MPTPEKRIITVRDIERQFPGNTRILIELMGPVDRKDFWNTPGRLMAVTDSTDLDFDNDPVHKAHREALSDPNIQMYVTFGIGYGSSRRRF